MNDNFGEFVRLSPALSEVTERSAALRRPLQQLRSAVSAVRATAEDSLSRIAAAARERARLVTRRDALRRIIEADRCVTRLETLSQIGAGDRHAEEQETVTEDAVAADVADVMLLGHDEPRARRLTQLARAAQLHARIRALLEAAGSVGAAIVAQKIAPRLSTMKAWLREQLNEAFATEIVPDVSMLCTSLAGVAPDRPPAHTHFALLNRSSYMSVYALSIAASSTCAYAATCLLKNRSNPSESSRPRSCGPIYKLASLAAHSTEEAIEARMRG